MKQWRELQGEEFALRLRDMLEKKQYRELRGAFSLFEAADIALLFEEFEEGKTPEARFARTMDNLQPLLLNRYS